MTNPSPVRLSPISYPGAATTVHDGWQLAETYSTVEAEVAAIRTAVGLADLSASGKLLIQGRDAATALGSALGNAPTDIGAVVAVGMPSRRVHWRGTGLLACLTREDWYLVTPIGGEGDALDKINDAIRSSGVFAHATDMTHAKGALLLAGPHSRDVLAKVCGLDFHPTVFPDRFAAQSSLAKVHAILIRHDLSRGSVPAYQIHLNRSEADYAWGALLDAAGEYGGQAVGMSAVEALR